MKSLATQASLIALLLLTSPSRAFNSDVRVAILAQNDGTEITDLLVPFALLSAAGVDVTIFSTEQGPVNLMNGLELLGLQSINATTSEEFSLVIVPAVHKPNQANLLRWLHAAHQQGATVASICDGVDVLAATGLLDGHQATGHFYSAKRRRRSYPGVIWQDNIRFVEDGRVFTTAGVSASAPATVYLIEKLVGKESAAAVSTAYAIDRSNGTEHNSSIYSVGLGELSVGVKNLVLGLRKRRYNLRSADGIDEYSFAFAVDALSRTFRASVTVDSDDSTFVTKHGLHIRGKGPRREADWNLSFDIPQRQVTAGTPTLELSNRQTLLPNLFRHIHREFGAGTADLVGLQLEIPERGAAYYDRDE